MFAPTENEEDDDVPAGLLDAEAKSGIADAKGREGGRQGEVAMGRDGGRDIPYD